MADRTKKVFLRLGPSPRYEHVAYAGEANNAIGKGGASDCYIFIL